MTVTAQSWANMTYDQQTFWIYFYVMAGLFLFIMPVFALAFLRLTDPEPARPPDRTAAWQSSPPARAALRAAERYPPQRDDAASPGTPVAPVAGVPGPSSGGAR